MVFFTAIELSAGGHSHEHIIRFWWEQNGKTGCSDIATIVSWLKRGNSAYVRVGGNTVEVKVVEPGGGRKPHIRTTPDHTGKDNLLALPRMKLAA
jgi:hypothetical protein